MKTIKLMADYQCFPLWDMTPGEYGDIDPYTLPISRDLQRRLYEWAATYDKTLNMQQPQNSGFKSKENEEIFIMEGEMLSRDLQKELGPKFKIIYTS